MISPVKRAEAQGVLVVLCGRETMPYSPLRRIQRRDPDDANSLSEEQFLEAINGTTRNMLGMNMKMPGAFPDNFFGQYYTMQNGQVIQPVP